MANLTTLENHVNVDEMIAAVAPEFARLRSSIQSRVHTAIAGHNTGELLTLKLRPSGREIQPSPSSEYLRYLWDYMKGKPSVESASVEEIALAAATSAIQDFYTSEEIFKILTKDLLHQLDANTALRNELLKQIGGTVSWLRREISTTLAGTGNPAVNQVVNSAAHAMSAALHTAGGQAVAGLAAKALAMPAVKAALVKAILAAAHSVAFQKLVLLSVKKFGVAALLQIFAVKLTAAGAGGAIPGLGWLVAGAIGGLLVYDYKTLPGKLADKISKDLANSLSNSGNELHETIVTAFVKPALKLIEDELTSSANR